MTTYRITIITNSNREYLFDNFETSKTTPEGAFGDFASKYGVPESGLAFPASYPKGRFVFIPTPAMSSIEITEIPRA